MVNARRTKHPSTIILPPYSSDGSHPSSVSGLLGRDFACVETFGHLFPLPRAAGRGEGLSPFLNPTARRARARLCNQSNENSASLFGVGPHTNMYRRVVPSVRSSEHQNGGYIPRPRRGDRSKRFFLSTTQGCRVALSEGVLGVPTLLPANMYINLFPVFTPRTITPLCPERVFAVPTVVAGPGGP